MGDFLSGAGLKAIWSWLLLLIGDHPEVALAVIGMLAVLVMARKAAAGRSTQKDELRAFSAAQRSEIASITGGRCEMEVVPFLRCRATGSHADHWIPWTAGGASSDENLVWACARHNLSKSSKMPTRGQTRRIARRRRGYFPLGRQARPGQRFVQRAGATR